MEKLHPLLKRQLKKFLKVKKIEDAPEDLLPFLNAINDAYWQSDEDRRMLERSLELSSEELLSANKKLQENIRKLKELDELKSAFLSSVSHELRTPLTSILGFAKLIDKDFKKHFKNLAQGDKKLKKKANRIVENLEVIIKEGERLTRLINDVLDIAKIESGKIEWKDEVFSLKELLEDAMTSVLGEFSQKPDVKPITEIPENLPNLCMDRDRLHQVLINLLNNAAKFTDKGYVKLWAEVKGDRVLIAVKDTGCGIPEEDKDKIFDKFHQVVHEDTLKDKPKGTGLGLAICKQIVEHYNGKIWVESELGKGSIFFIELPLKETEEKKEESTEVISHEDRIVEEVKRDKPLILVVDDEAGIRKLLYQIFTDADYNVITASTGKEAIEIAKKVRPNLITMDLMMPVMDGKTAIKYIREDKDLKNVPIVVISVLPQEEGEGADAYVGKPIDEKYLLEVVHSFLSPKRFFRESSGRPCLIVSDRGEKIERDFVLLCSGEVSYCKKEELMQKIEQGFQGTLLIPFNVYEDIEIKNLKKRGINIVII